MGINRAGGCPGVRESFSIASCGASRGVLRSDVEGSSKQIPESARLLAVGRDSDVASALSTDEAVLLCFPPSLFALSLQSVSRVRLLHTQKLNPWHPVHREVSHEAVVCFMWISGRTLTLTGCGRYHSGDGGARWSAFLFNRFLILRRRCGARVSEAFRLPNLESEGGEQLKISIHRKRCGRLGY